MNPLRLTVLFAVLLPAGTALSQFDDDSAAAKAVPGDRRAMLAALDALKQRPPRLPLPPPADEDRGVNNGRMRQLYLPASWSGRRGGNRDESNLPGGYELATQLFWIVSRVNNCHYCLGHQEGKLQRVGMNESSLLALDTDWTQFSEAEQAAFEFTRKLTFAPHAVGDQDIEALQQHFRDADILQILYLVGRYNATNRWTDSLGIPQETERDFSSRLAPDQLALPSRVAVDRFPPRPSPGGFEEWNRRLAAARARSPRLSIDAAHAPASADIPPHLQLLSSVSGAGPAAAEAVQQAYRPSEIPLRLKQMIAIVAAAEDHAWYMQDRAAGELQALGFGRPEIHQLVANREAAQLSDAERTALDFAAQLTREPLSIHDGHIARLREHYSHPEVAEIVHHVGIAAMLNRLTEATGLGRSAIADDTEGAADPQ